MRKSLKWISIIALVALLAAGAYFYFNPKKALNIIIPEISDIERVRIKFIGDTAYVRITLNAENKSFFKLHIDTLSYHIQLDTSTLLSKSEYLNLELQRHQRDSIQLPLALPFKRLMHKIQSLQTQDSVDIPIELRVVYSTVLGKAVLPFSKTLKIETPHPPKFKIEKIEYVRYHRKELLLNAHVLMINPGKINLNVSGVSYTMTVKDLFIAKGREEKVLKIKPHTTLPITLPINVEFKNIFKTARLILENKDKVHYHLILSGYIQNDKLGEDKTPVLVEKDGVMELKK